MSRPVVRFAPSPTGRIHIGNARTALLNFLFARREGGRFILRFDDTDAERSRAEYADAIEVDLAWLGVVPDALIRQSERLALYRAAAETLRGQGRLYPAFETSGELERRRKRQQALGQPPIYDRAALALDADARRALEAEGRRPHWRFRLDGGVVEWDDRVRGPSHIDCSSLSDPVLIREDGSYLYTLPSVVDDIETAVTDVIRGEDHVTNTAVQIQIFQALAGAAPRFGHHNLLTDSSGEGLSKRTGSLSIASLRDSGIEALAAAALAVLTGSAEAVRPVASLAELAAMVDLSHLSRGAARFDEAELRALSARTLHATPFEDVRDRLAACEIVGAEAAPFWAAVRGNLERFDDARDWWRIIHAADLSATLAAMHLASDDQSLREMLAEHAAVLREAAACLPEEPWSAATWGVWTNALKARTSLKGRALFHPLRLALTGRESGPELAALLPLIGRVRASDRLSAPVA
jgi:glutamyl-tRNA synthetase